MRVETYKHHKTWLKCCNFLIRIFDRKGNLYVAKEEMHTTFDYSVMEITYNKNKINKYKVC